MVRDMWIVKRVDSIQPLFKVYHITKMYGSVLPSIGISPVRHPGELLIVSRLLKTDGGKI